MGLSVPSEYFCQELLEEVIYSPSSSLNVSEDIQRLRKRRKAIFQEERRKVLGRRKRRECSFGTGTQYIHDNLPVRDLLTSVNGSLGEIQEISSIVCNDASKTSAVKTPRNSNSPIKTSTPLIPVDQPPKFSSTVTKYKDYCVMTIDTSCWATHDVSLLGVTTFPAPCATGVRIEELPAIPHPSAGFVQ
ncbi:hypothetical protein E2320_018090, partial [Naja naja]